jgi:trimethylamine--corrinoid protein Co-methyltransferase
MIRNAIEDLTFGYANVTRDDVVAMHEATLKIMGDFGVRVAGEEAQALYLEAGCTVDKETDMVKFPASVIEDAIASAPDTFAMYGRDPDYKVVAGGRNVIFTNFSAGVEIDDPYTGERRATTLEDLRSVTRFLDGLPHVDRLTLPVIATDAPAEIKELYEAEALFSNTTKHFAHDADGKEKTRLVFKMAAEVAGGYDKLRERPIISGGCCPTSPLEITRDGGEQIIEAARHGLPCNILSMGLCGGTTPVTLAGTILTCNCEVLAGIVLSQLADKGAPVFYGSSTTIMDMKRMTSPVGAPEHAMIGSAVAAIGKYYGIPTYVGGT